LVRRKDCSKTAEPKIGVELRSRHRDVGADLPPFVTDG
jgi:hypothetical protein